jgi:hypothetical protein
MLRVLKTVAAIAAFEGDCVATPKRSTAGRPCSISPCSAMTATVRPTNRQRRRAWRDGFAGAWTMAGIVPVNVAPSISGTAISGHFRATIG